MSRPPSDEVPEPPADRTCESCGSTETVLWAVRRIYVTPAEPGFEDLTETTHRTLDETEHWCIACCASYPHEQVGLTD